MTSSVMRRASPICWGLGSRVECKILVNGGEEMGMYLGKLNWVIHRLRNIDFCRAFLVRGLRVKVWPNIVVGKRMLR